MEKEVGGRGICWKCRMAGDGLAFVEKQRLPILLVLTILSAMVKSGTPLVNGRESARLIFKTVADPQTSFCHSYCPGRTYKASSPQAFLSCAACIASSWVKGAVQ